MPVVTETGDLQVRRLDPRSDVEALVVTRGGSAGAGSSGSDGGNGEGLIELPLSGPESSKAPMVEGEPQREAHVERVEFVSPAGSSSHAPIMSGDLAEFMGEAALAWLMIENPVVVEIVMAARKERQR